MTSIRRTKHAGRRAWNLIYGATGNGTHSCFHEMLTRSGKHLKKLDAEEDGQDRSCANMQTTVGNLQKSNKLGFYHPSSSAFPAMLDLSGE